MKKVAFYNFDNIDLIKKYFLITDVEFYSIENLENINSYDIVITNNCIESVNKNIVNVHPSLLPAYPSNDAVFRAFQDGVKVSGVTIHTKDKIIAQYPILIGVKTHIGDFLNELSAVQNKLLPPVINSILNDRVFDFNDLFSGSCNNSGGCSGCGKCGNG